jgi:hypothetical protein
MPEKLKRLVQTAAAPSFRAELIAWVLIISAIVFIRVYLWHVLPVYIWSRDSRSYIAPAVHAFETGEWQADARRGPIYSLFILGNLAVTRNLASVVIAQHVLGGLAIVIGIALLRFWFGRGALVPLLFCGINYALYQSPISLEHLIRNETLLFFFSSVAFAALGVAFVRGGASWFALAGFSAALLTITKNIFVPLPVVVLGLIIWQHWKNWRRVAPCVSAFLLAFLIPFTGWKAYGSAAGDLSGGYAGVQLYGRVAQWTTLNTPLHAEIKKEIAPLVREYAGRPELDNNWVIKRGIVPVIQQRLKERGQNAADVDTLCKQLAFEAIRTHPGKWFRQVLDDLRRLHGLGKGGGDPNVKTLKNMIASLDADSDLFPVLRLEEAASLYREKITDGNLFQAFHRITDGALLFELVAPALLTTILLPLLIVFDAGPRRLFWVAAASVWFFNIALLSTVGKPLNRYFVPLAPLMFWALSVPICCGWARLIRLARRNV